MTTENKKIELVFAPGCFDNFEGTQEELDELIAEIQASFDSGDFLSKAVPLDDLDDDEITEILDSMSDDDTPRTLQ